MAHANLIVMTFTPPTHISDLPQEIINLIVDLVAEISQDRRKALRTCNAVSRSFHARAQQNLFEAIQFVVDCSASNRAQHLRRILQASPHLVGRIHSFKVIVKDPGYLMGLSRPSKMVPSFWFRRAVRDLGAERPLGISKEHFLWLFQTISSAPVINFAVVAEGKTLNWSTLSDCSRSLLLSIRSSPRLKSLELSNIIGLTNRMIIGPNQQNSPIVLQDSLPIENLVIRHCRLETSSTIVFDIPSIVMPFRHLRTLDITESPECSASFLSELQMTLDIDSTSASQSFCFPALTMLATSLNLDSIGSTQSVKNLMTCCRKTLKCLKLRLSDPKRDPSSAEFTLPRMPVLQEIWINIKARNADITQPYLKFVTRTLRSSSSSFQALETIGLDLEIENANGREIQAAFGWEEFDKTVVDQDAFPNLSNVVIALKIECFHYYGDHQAASDSKIIDAKDVLPLTKLSGRIHIDVRNTAQTDWNF